MVSRIVRFSVLGLFCLLSTSMFSQVKLSSFDDLNKRIHSTESDTVFVVNFWATWCGPCVKELPSFKESQVKLESENVKYIFISLDFVDQKENVSSFFKESGLEGEVVMLSDENANVWIDKVKKEWQGNIPVTWFVDSNSSKEIFHSGTIKSSEIIKTINKLNK